jgi:hypothetical protein
VSPHVRTRADLWRWRRHKILLIVAALPLVIGGWVTAAIAAPPVHGPVRPVQAVRPVTGPDLDCTLTIPNAPLTARGLATPYILSATTPAAGPCHESDSAQSAFAQAAVYDPATGAISVYDPLVVDAGHGAALAPGVPAIPAGAVVGIWFGYNGNNLTIRSARGAGLAPDHCVDGLGESVFSQFAYCNAKAFFAAVNTGIATHKLVVPALGTANDGQPCPTTRDFSIVDQDQSDNVTTRYLVTAGGRTAQDTSANAARLPDADVLSNPSDNALLDEFVDTALGCTPWTVRDLGGGTATSLALDEIQANADQARPAALVPLNDPMTTVGGARSAAKTDLYRVGVDQASLPAGGNPRTYCQDMDSIQSARLKHDANLFAGAPSPAAAAAINLFTFLAARLSASFHHLGCARFGLADPVSSESVDDAGAVTAVTFAS